MAVEGLPQCCSASATRDSVRYAAINEAVQVVGIRAAEEQVSEFLTCTIAANFMANRIVAPVVDTPADSESRQDVHEALGTLQLFKQASSSHRR